MNQWTGLWSGGQRTSRLPRQPEF